jgi:hypothetical protein
MLLLELVAVQAVVNVLVGWLPPAVAERQDTQAMVALVLPEQAVVVAAVGNTPSMVTSSGRLEAELVCLVRAVMAPLALVMAPQGKRAAAVQEVPLVMVLTPVFMAVAVDHIRLAVDLAVKVVRDLSGVLEDSILLRKLQTFNQKEYVLK